jgi:1-acyl-sn-glycerol-3-phosphate acyltransferase
LYWVVKAVLGPFLRTFWRPWVEGLDHVPDSGPAILASNHLSFLDSIFLPLVVPRRVTYLAKSDYFTESGVKGWFKRHFFRGVGQVPIDRSGGEASDAALRSGVRVLEHGRLLGIYPEGTRSPDGRLYRGKIGVAKMAVEASVPVIPIAMIGTREVQPPGRLMPKVRRVGIRIGRPLDFKRYNGVESDRYVLRSITDEIMYEVMQLSGQEYVDMYAQRAKDEIEAARAAAVEAVGGNPPDITETVRTHTHASGGHTPGTHTSAGRSGDTSGTTVADPGAPSGQRRAG